MMIHAALLTRLLPAAAVLAATLALALPAAGLAPITVDQQLVNDRKAVFGTVQTRDIVDARSRLGGTVSNLTVDEGTAVEADQQIALVTDPKLEVQLDAANARIEALKARLELAATTLDRVQQLFSRGNAPRARLDEAETALEVVKRELKAAVAEREVILERESEGTVFAPARGRVTAVTVTDGSVVLPGDTIATIAVKGSVVRVQLPERHARFIHPGDPVLVGALGLGVAGSGSGSGSETLRTGRVTKVYPELDRGRVIADVEVEGLGEYFVGERVRVYVSTGQRPAIFVPAGYVYERFGVSFVRVQNTGETVVQLGERRDGEVEILGGLEPGDVILPPETAAPPSARVDE